MKKIVLLNLLIWTLASACQKTLLPDPPSNTPANNFDELWKGFDRWYGGFGVRNINWDSLYQVNRPKIHANMNNAELYSVLCELIDPVNDIHVFLQPTTDGLPRFESSEFFREKPFQDVFSAGLVKSKYLPQLNTIDDKLHYGIMDDNIGYLHLGEFGKPLKFYQQQMTTILAYLKNTQSLIIDIRDHSGGDDRVSSFIAGCFSTEPKLFMATRKRNGPAHDDFTKTEYWYTPVYPEPYVKPVFLLTSRWTASAGETFTWALNTQQQVLQIGDTTAGAFTDVVARELPNGWLYFLGVGDYRNALGNSEEGIGVAPDIRVVNSKEDIEGGKDKMLEEAIRRATGG